MAKSAPAAPAHTARPRRHGRYGLPRSRPPASGIPAGSAIAAPDGAARRARTPAPILPLPVMTSTKVKPSLWARCRKPNSARCARVCVMPCRSSRASISFRPRESCERSRRPIGASGGGFRLWREHRFAAARRRLARQHGLARQRSLPAPAKLDGGFARRGVSCAAA